MTAIKITDNDIEYIKSLIENDITEAALDVSFFDKMKIEPKDYIEQMIALANMFGMDFWEVIARHCSDFESRRMVLL